MLGFAPNSISCISFYNIFLCFSYRILDLKHAAGWGTLPRAASPSYLFISTDNPAYIPEAYLALRLGGWTQKKTTRCGLYDLPSSQARGLDSPKLLDAASCEDGRQEKSYAVSHDVWSLIPNLGIWIQGSGAAGYVSSTAYFSNFLRIQARRL